MTKKADQQVRHNEAFFQDTEIPVRALFNHLERGANLLIFLAQHPAVSHDQALAAMSKKHRQEVHAVVDSNEQYLSGTPRFAGTQVPIRNMIDYLAGGYPLEEFLKDFPGVN